MIVIIILSLIYALGFYVSYSMNRIELAAEKEPYTFGGRLLNIAYSLLSWGFVLFLLAAAWFAKINATGYWKQPIKAIEPQKETKE